MSSFHNVIYSFSFCYYTQTELICLQGYGKENNQINPIFSSFWVQKNKNT